MTGYDSFRITTIDIDKFNSRILINCNQDVLPSSVNIETVSLVNNADGSLLHYELKVESTCIQIYLNTWPNSGDQYMLSIKGIENVIEDTLETPLDRLLTFTSVIDSVINIISPDNFENVSDLTVKITETSTNPINQYYLEISSDIGFYNIVKNTTMINQTEINLGSFDPGQYYIRCRAQNDTDIGNWSRIVSFIFVAADSNPQPVVDIYPDFQTDFNILTAPENGTTPSSFIIEFDDDIDLSSLGEITIIRRSL